MKTKKEINHYDRQYVNSRTNYVSISDYRELDINTVVKKIESELVSKMNKIKEKGLFSSSFTIQNFTFNANINVKRLETDKEYNARIAKYEKTEELRRKKEEEKIKKEFKKLEELKQKFEDVSSAEEAIMKVRKKRAADSILPNLVK